MRFFVTIGLFFLSFQHLDCLRNHGRKLSPRMNFFDMELLSVTAGHKRGNVMISPASIKSTLAMILAGAEGETAREIILALRLTPEDTIDQLRLYLEALRANTTTAVLQNANGVFVSNNLKLNPRYESIVRQQFQSEVTSVDFSNPTSAAGVVNSWVNERTHGLIPFIVEPIHVTPPNDLILANALYFKSSWLYAFNPRQTRSSCFYRDEECKMVPMMDLQTDLNHAHVEDLRAHAVELPYVGRRYSMILLVPLMKDGINNLIRDLPYVGIHRIMELMHPNDVILSMPRFTVNYNEDLVDSLRHTHITTLFSNHANLSKIFQESHPHVNSFHHKVFMSVDETGTVAAASSAAAIVPLMFDGTVQVRADRPFLFFIRDNELGIILFEGKIEDPSVLENTHAPVPVPNDQAPILAQVPVQVPFQGPNQVPFHGPNQVPLQGPNQVPFQVHGQVPVQVPGPVPGQVPAQAPIQFPVQAPAQVPVQFVGQVPNHVPGQVSNQVAGQVPNQVAGQVPNQVAGQVPNQVPGQVPNQVPGQVPNQVPGQVPKQVPGQVPNQIPGQVPVETRIGEMAQTVQPLEIATTTLKPKSISETIAEGFKNLFG